MLTSLSDYMRMIISATGDIDIIRVVFFFKADSIETLQTKRKEPLSDDSGNFQWQACWIHFSREDKNGNLKYYIYRLGLLPNGKKSESHNIYDSDQNMNVSEIIQAEKKDIEPAKDILPADLEKSPAYKALFGKPTSEGIFNFRFKKPEADFINSQENKSYTRKKFEEDYENNVDEGSGKYFYTLFSERGNKKLSPFGETRQFKKEEKPVEESPEKTAVRLAMKIAKEIKPETGGMDIMKRLVEKLRTTKKKKDKKDYYTNGWGIIRKWQKEQQHQSTKNKPNSDGFDIMQEVVKHPEPIRKKSLMEPLEKDPPKKPGTKRKFS